MKRLQRGVLITFEGIDGCGKSTLAHGFADTLNQHSFDVVLTKEPGATAVGKKIRTLVQEEREEILPVAEALLFAADRAMHINQIVQPALRDHKIVVSDRMADSSRVYQGCARGVDCTRLENVLEWVMDGTKPDLTFFVELSIDDAFERMKDRKQLSRFEQEARDFHLAVLDGYNALYAGKDHVLRLDGRMTPQELVDEAYARTLAWLERQGLMVHESHNN